MTSTRANYAEFRLLQLSDGVRKVTEIEDIIFDETNIAPYLIRENIQRSLLRLKSENYLTADDVHPRAVHGGNERYLVEFGYPPPIVVNWEITSACNSKCPHCYANAASCQSGELSLREMCKTAEELRRLEPTIIDISGGEPVLHKDFFEMLPLFHDIFQGSATKLKLLTNGTLVTAINVERIARYFSAVHISIDGIGQTHDQFRKIKDGFASAVNALRLFSTKGVPVCMTVTIHNKNLKEIRSIVDLALKEKVQRLRFGFFNPSGRGVANHSEHTIPLDARHDIFNLIVRLKNELKDQLIIDSRERFYGITNKGSSYSFLDCNSIFCRAGTRLMFINSTGNVTPCYMLNEKQFFAGNIRKQPVEEIWQKSEVFRKLRSLSISDIESCRDCQKSKDCGAGMRCAAYGLYGKLDERDPQCIFPSHTAKSLRSA